jgi:hypothetical protein
MELLSCGHAAPAGSSRICAHLTGVDGGAFIGRLAGHGSAIDLCCRECDLALRHGEPIELLVVCEECLTRCTSRWWTGLRLVAPDVVDRPEAFDATIVEISLPAPVVDIAPVAAEHGSVWLLLTDDGRIGRFHADQGTWEVLAQSAVPEESSSREWVRQQQRRRLHASANGRYAAVVNDYGRYGQVLDLTTGVVTVTLDGGGYHSDTVPFATAFVEHGGRTLVIHRSEWNRLDVSDASTGRLLTPRPTPEYRSGEPAPEHYLDYFHGALHTSPGGRRVVDDGWVWSPVGIPAIWDVGAWLDDNVWESEDGASRHYLVGSDDWNVPMCWLDDERVVVGGIVGDDDDEKKFAAVWIFDAASGVELISFAGPTGKLFADAARLYAAAPAGLELWDPVAGHRVGAIQGFVPTRHHAGAGELAVVDGQVLRRWRTLS